MGLGKSWVLLDSATEFPHRRGFLALPEQSKPQV